MAKAIVYCHCGERSHGYGLCRKHYQDKYRDAQDERYFTSPKGRFQVLNHNAKLNNREVTITFEEYSELLLKHTTCTYCAGSLGRGSVADRINNDLGYTKDNIRITCDGCNSLKSNTLTEYETEQVVKLLKTLRNKDDIWNKS